MTEQLHDDHNVQELSEPERRFTWRWQQLVDQAGGRKVVTNRIAGWTRPTVYRDYAGKSLPTAERLRQLGDHLGLPEAERDELLRMLDQARSVRQARRQGPGGSTGLRLAGDGPAGNGSGPRRRHWALAWLVAGAVTAVVVAAGLWWWQPWQGLAGSTDSGAVSTTNGGLAAEGSYRGLVLKAVSVPASALTPAMAKALGHGGASVEGYAFRNMKNPDLCLTTAETGPAAGQNRDRVDVEPCDYAANQVWLPLQWEAKGTRFTQLVSLRYQSKCLNADNIGGLADSHRTQLWNCYQSPNEYWDFGDWYQHVKDGQAYPVFVESGRFCLDADKNDFGSGGAGAQVNIWKQWNTNNEFWS